MTRFKRDAIISRAGKGKERAGGGERGEITRLSRDSLKRLSFVANNAGVEFTHMLTLTYPMMFPKDGETVKKHFKSVKTAMNRRGIDYLWFLEFQARGAAHIHLLLKLKSENDGHKLGAAWRSVVGKWLRGVDSEGRSVRTHAKHGYDLAAIRSQNGAGRYVAKYCAKGEQKIVPAGFSRVGRWWGHSGAVKPVALETWELELIDLPEQALGRGEYLDEYGVIHNTVWPWRVQFGVGENWEQCIEQLANSGQRNNEIWNK